MIASSCFVPRCFLPRWTVTTLSWGFQWEWECSFAMSLIFSLETAAEWVDLVSVYLIISFISALMTEKKFWNQLDFRSIQIRWWKPAGWLHLQVVFCAPVGLATALSLVKQFSPLHNCYLGLFADLARTQVTAYTWFTCQRLFSKL